MRAGIRGWCQCGRLTTCRLALSHNPQIAVPSQIVQCDRLRYLNIRWNQLKYFPEAVGRTSRNGKRTRELTLRRSSSSPRSRFSTSARTALSPSRRVSRT